MATKNGLVESLVIRVTCTVSPEGTEPMPPEPAADEPPEPEDPLVAAPLEPESAAEEELELDELALELELEELLDEPALELLLLHALTMSAAAVSTASGINRFARWALLPCIASPSWVGTGGRATDPSTGEPGDRMPRRVDLRRRKGEVKRRSNARTRCRPARKAS